MSSQLSLIEKINQLPPDKIAEVVDFVDFLRERGSKHNGTLVFTDTDDETALLKTIREKSRIPFRKRLNELRRKLENEILTPDERDELLDLNHRLEAMNADRIAALGALANLHGVTLTGIMNQLGIKQPNA